MGGAWAATRSDMSGRVGHMKNPCRVRSCWSREKLHIYSLVLVQYTELPQKAIPWKRHSFIASSIATHAAHS